MDRLVLLGLIVALSSCTMGVADSRLEEPTAFVAGAEVDWRSVGPLPGPGPEPVEYRGYSCGWGRQEWSVLPMPHIDFPSLELFVPRVVFPTSIPREVLPILECRWATMEREPMPPQRPIARL